MRSNKYIVGGTLGLMLQLNAVQANELSTPAFLMNTPWETAALSEDVDPLLLYSISLVESSRMVKGERSSYPHQFTIRDSRGAFYFSNKEEAVAALNKSLEIHQPWEIDVCAMQINLKWHGDKVDHDYARLFDLDTCLKVGSKILSEAIHHPEESNDAAIMIGRYHSWKPERARYYGEMVLNVMTNIRKHGAI